MNNWLHVDLAGDVSNRCGIGARLQIKAGSLTAWRQVCSDGGVNVHNSLTVEFGLGAHTIVDTLRVFWPSGQISQLMQVAPNQRIPVSEADLAQASEDQFVSFGQVVTVDGSGSVDSQGGNQITYSWSIPEGAWPNATPYVEELSPDDSVAYRFVAPSTVQSLLVRLQVHDVWGYDDYEGVIITVLEDTERAVFVSDDPSWGNDGNSGGWNDPLATIDYAVQKAMTYSPPVPADIYLHEGDYPSAGITILEGMSVYGGFDKPAQTGGETIWIRPQADYTANEPTTIDARGNSATAITALSVNDPTWIEGLTIYSGDGADGSGRGQAGENSIGVKVTDSWTDLIISNNVIHAGCGGDGAPGAAGAVGVAGAEGKDGHKRGKGGGGGAGAGGHNGGRGGGGGLTWMLDGFDWGAMQEFLDDVGRVDGYRGDRSVDGISGGARGTAHVAFDASSPFYVAIHGNDGGEGSSGGPGSGGIAGEGGRGWGSFESGDWIGVSGTAGGSGTPGQGGGGGGGGGPCLTMRCYLSVPFVGCVPPFPLPFFYYGGGGGGGGGGAGGGLAGDGGQPGGGSFAIYLNNSVPVIKGNELHTTGGGAGGAGGSGGDGGANGPHGEGGGPSAVTIDPPLNSPLEDAGDGGDGGWGGHGGGGGGGGGGIGGCSCGIMPDRDSQVYETNNDYTGVGPEGTGGAGGEGGWIFGSSAEAGAAGMSRDICSGSRSYKPFSPILVNPGEEIRNSLPIVGISGVSFGVNFSGSDVMLTLESPTGQEINRDTVDPDVVHIKGPTYEYYQIEEPEEGTWWVVLTGVEVPSGGEEAIVSVAEVPVNQAPIADAGENQAIQGTSFDGAIATLNGNASSDPEEDFLTYSWADATMAPVGSESVVEVPAGFGPQVFTLTVEDERGLVDTDPVTITVIDTIPPELSLSTHIVEASTLEDSVVVLFTELATAIDVCDPAPVVSFDPLSGSYFQIGATQVACSAVDAFDNTVVDSFWVFVSRPTVEVSGSVFMVDITTQESYPAAALTVFVRAPEGILISECLTDSAGVFACEGLSVDSTYHFIVEELAGWIAVPDTGVAHVQYGSPEMHFYLKLDITDFEDATSGPVGDDGPGRGIAWGDYDNDGDQDFYLSQLGEANILFRNEGDGSFTNATSPPLDDSNEGRGVAWADYDNDGDLDLYLANDGQANKLFRNDGLGGFEDVTGGPVGDTGYAQGIACGDYDNDGNVDLYLVRGNESNVLLRNLGDGSFADVTSYPLGDQGDARGVAWCDYDLDGDLDLYLARSNNNRLLRNDGDGDFTDVTSGPLGNSARTYGVAWGDYDNDGDFDLYMGNADRPCVLCRNDGSGVFTNVTNATGCLGDVGRARGVGWADYDNDGDLDLYVGSRIGADRLFRNDGSGTFTDVTDAPLGSTVGCYGMAWADYDSDGDQDLYLANWNTPNALYKNNAGNWNHWLKVRLLGSFSNASGIGARVRMVSGGGGQVREISGGSGLYSQNSLVAHFGLGTWSVVDTLYVYWPSGFISRVMDVAADQTVVVDEEAAGIGNPTEVVETIRLHSCLATWRASGAAIRYDLPAAADVSIQIFDTTGRLVRTLLDHESRGRGRHATTWDLRDDHGLPVSTGIYLYRLETKEFRGSSRIVLIR